MLRTPEREDKYKWVGPLASMRLVFFKKKNSSITLNNISDAKKVKKIGVAKGVANFEMLSSQGFKNLVVLQGGDDEQNIQKLVDGEIDLWPTLLMAGLYNARLQGLAGEVVPIDNVIAFSGDLYLAFNINTDDAIVEQWQNALTMVRNRNEVKEISQRYKDNNEIDYSFFIKIFAVLLIVSLLILYHNRTLLSMNKKLRALQDELKDQANKDPMTNLYNRRYFNDIVIPLINRGKRSNQDIAILVLDIDDFKLVNDRYGHGIGDDVIKEVASVLNKNTRENDILCRFGGEEFIILLSDTSIESALLIAEKLRKNVENLSLVSDNDEEIRVTISIGISMIDYISDTDIETSIKRADKALYAVKDNGKNKVELA